FLRFRWRSVRPGDRGRADRLHPRGGEVRGSGGAEGADRARLRGGQGVVDGMRRMRKSGYALLGVALVLAGLSLFNASWLAGRPSGRLTLIAHRGSGLPLVAGAPGDCNARHVVPGTQTNLIENSAGALTKAMSDGAGGLMLDVQATRDGEAIVFRDRRLECRTNGTGAVAERDF